MKFAMEMRKKMLIEYSKILSYKIWPGNRSVSMRSFRNEVCSWHDEVLYVLGYASFLNTYRMDGCVLAMFHRGISQKNF
jgi:hypothetical protein